MKFSHYSTEQLALCEVTLFRELAIYRWCRFFTPQRRTGEALCEQRQRLPNFVNRPVVVGAELALQPEQQDLCEQRHRLFISRTDQLSVVRHFNTAAQNRKLCVSRDEG